MEITNLSEKNLPEANNAYNDISLADCLYDLGDYSTSDYDFAFTDTPDVIRTAKKTKHSIAAEKKWLIAVALIISIGGLVFALFNIGLDIYADIMQRKIDLQVNQLFSAAGSHSYSEEPAETATPAAVDIEPDYSNESDWDRERRLLLEAEAAGRIIYADLLEINPDFLGMIEIPGVIERQPYVMSADNIDYLSKNFHGQRTGTGTIFLNASSDRLLMDNNSTFFGHYNERTEGMFTRLMDYRKAETYVSSPVVILDGLIGESVWIIFAAHVVIADELWMSSFNNETEYSGHLELIRELSLFDIDVDVTVNDRIITLSVCDYTYDDSRLLVHARKLRPGETIPDAVIEIADGS